VNTICGIVILGGMVCVLSGCGPDGSQPRGRASPKAPTAPGQQASNTVLVFILAGQSNMAGAGDVSHLMAPQRRTPPNVRLFEGGQFRELVHGKTFGPEVGFVDGLLKAGVRQQIVLCKLAVGGTHLHGNWNPRARPPGPQASGRSGLYPRLIAQLNALRKLLRGEGYNVVIAGALWMQGERDARSKEMAEGYQENLTRLIASLREDTHVADLPVLIGRICPRMLVVDLGPCVRIHAYREQVRAAQVAVAAKDPRVELIYTDDLPQFDNLHFDAAGQLALGRRFAQAYLKLTGR